MRPTSLVAEATSPTPTANLKTPYTEQADFAVEQRIDKKTTLAVAYLWNTGQDFLTKKDDNLVAPTSTYTYILLDANNNQTGTYTTPVYTAVNDPAHGVLNHIYNGGKLYYDGLAVSLARTQSKNTSFNLAYTWSHAIDLGLGAGADNIYYTDPPVSVLNGNPRDEKGRSPLDQRHRLVASGLISAPHIGYGNTLLNESLNGWQFSAIETFATPQGRRSLRRDRKPSHRCVQRCLYLHGQWRRALASPPISVPDSLRGAPSTWGTTIRTDFRLTKEFKLPARGKPHSQLRRLQCLQLQHHYLRPTGCLQRNHEPLRSACCSGKQCGRIHQGRSPVPVPAQPPPGFPTEPTPVVDRSRFATPSNCNLGSLTSKAPQTSCLRGLRFVEVYFVCASGASEQCCPAYSPVLAKRRSCGSSGFDRRSRSINAVAFSRRSRLHSMKARLSPSRSA